MQKIIFSVFLIFLAIMFVGGILPPTVHAQGSENILIIFDASGSMKDQLGGQTKIDFAKTDAANLLSSLDPAINVGLRPLAYTQQSTKAAACVDTSLVQPFTTDRGTVSSAISNLQAIGLYTPLAYALQQSASDFTPGNDNVVILLTDGQENCGGDPAAAAAALRAAGINVKVDVIGLGVDSATRSQLQSVAQSGGGQYFDASNSSSLSSSLAAIATAEKPIDKTNTDSLLGTSVTGGNGYETAVPITPGMYHLSHDQVGGQFDYFIMNVKTGDVLDYSVQSSEQAVIYNKVTNTFAENTDHSGDYAGIKVYSSTRVKLGYVYVFNVASSLSKDSITIDEDGPIYFLIGSDQSGYDFTNMSKKSIFTIKVNGSTVADTTQTPPPSETQNNPSQDSSSNSNGTQANTNVSSSGGSSSSNNSIMFIAIGVGALVVVLLIILIVVIAVKKKTPPNIPTNTPQNPSLTPPPPPPTIPPQGNLK